MALILGHWQLRGYGMWAAEDKQARALVGRIGLNNPEGWPALEVGWLIDRARWGQGLATEGGRPQSSSPSSGSASAHVASIIQPGTGLDPRR